MALTDKQIQYIFSSSLSNHNGSVCGAVLKTHYFEEGDYQNEICTGKTRIIDGKLKILTHCGEPCQFLQNVLEFDAEVEKLVILEKLIEEAKKNVPA